MLWKFACCSFRQTNHTLRFSNPRVNLFKENTFSKIKEKFKQNYEKFSTSSTKKPFKVKQCLAVTLISGAVSLKLTNLIVADCAGIADDKQYNNFKSFEDENPKFDWYKFYLMLLPDKWFLLLAVGCAILVAVLNVQIPIYLGNLINVMTKFLHQKEGSFVFRDEMRSPVSLLVALYAAQSVATFAYISLLSSVGERLAARMKTALFSSIVQQDLAFFDKVRTGELVDCLTTDIQEFKSAFKLCISQGLRSITQVGGCVVTLYIVSPAMTSLMVVVVPSIILAGTFLGSFLRSMSREAQLQVAETINHGEEAISNIRTVRAFANELKESSEFESEVWKSCKLYERLGLGIGMFQAGTNFFLNGIVLGTLYCGGYLMASGDMSAGDLMSFLVATQTIQRSIAQMSLLFGNFIKGMQSGARVFQLINKEPSIPISGGQTVPYHSLIPEVRFKDVTFAYPTRPEQVILKNFNLTIEAGKSVAIVGSSGNGKSTVAGLLERFYDVDSGSILVAGYDIKELDPNWLRGRLIGMINQEPILFATTILENIRYGKKNATDDEVFQAAKQANAHEFISSFPQGYNTVVGERGVTVSGGQKQRIAIARALLKNPSILILDEATSALDMESEKVVQKALDEVTKHRTVLVIAHRLSTIKNADAIVVLNNGVIVEVGKHEELMGRKGHYWNLMNQQAFDKRALG